METVIINCFDTYEERIDLIHDFFVNIGHNVTVIQSDFRHFKKVHRKDCKQDFIFVKSKPYYKNMSIERLSSHYRYAKDALRLIEELQPDLIYVIVPPNSLAKFAAEYKMKNKKVKLIFDLIDLWPETMPVGKVKVLPPFIYWRMMRDKSLKFADFVITECNLYVKVLKSVLKGIQTETIYLAKKNIKVISTPIINIDEIHLCYLGSINNIIDISKITTIVKSINDFKPTTLHIIGDGESKEELINKVKSTGAKVEYHGRIYNHQEKQDVFDRCHFGLNIMKESVCVGLTMKSIDYFQHGLPVINNIQADTFELVRLYNIGYNVDDNNLNEIVSKIVNHPLSDFINFRENTKKLFENNFSQDKFFEKLNNVIKVLDVNENRQ